MWQQIVETMKQKLQTFWKTCFFGLFFCMLPGSWRAEAVLLTLTLEARGEIDHGRSASLFQSPWHDLPSFRMKNSPTSSQFAVRWELLGDGRLWSWRIGSGVERRAIGRSLRWKHWRRKMTRLSQGQGRFRCLITASNRPCHVSVHANLQITWEGTCCGPLANWVSADPNSNLMFPFLVRSPSSTFFLGYFL